MRTLFSAVVVLLAITTTGCAKRPENIQASYVSTMQYMHWSCQQLAEEAGRLSSAYTIAAEQQSNARSNDTWGVVLIGLPVSSLSGDNIAPQIAQLKGEQKAVHQAFSQKNCGSQAGPAETLMVPTADGTPMPAPTPTAGNGVRPGPTINVPTQD